MATATVQRGFVDPQPLPIQSLTLVLSRDEAQVLRDLFSVIPSSGVFYPIWQALAEAMNYSEGHAKIKETLRKHFA